MNEKHEKTSKYLNYVELLLILTVTGCVSISAFASLVCVSVGITSYVEAIKICAITARIKTYNSVFKEKKKKHNEIVMLEKTKLDTIES